MDSIEPEQTPFAAVSAQTTKLGRVRVCLLLAELDRYRNEVQMLTSGELAISSAARQVNAVCSLQMAWNWLPPFPLLH